MTAMKSILLIEDNEQDELLTLRALKINQILNPVTVVRDGAEALDYLFARGAYAGRDSHDLPQMVLLDLNLPKIDGHEVLRQLRAHPKTKRLPVVVLTTSCEDHDIERAYDSGANSYVRKPIDFTQFSEAVKNLAFYWLLLNQTPRHDH
jgi:two-component system response regulator